MSEATYPKAIRRTYPLRDGELSALHFGRTANPLKIVFLHANGFNAQSYSRIFTSLGVHAVVFDMRGHGQSRDMPLKTSDLRSWNIFRDDCIEFFDRYVPDLTQGQVLLAGHSFGAVAGVMAADALTDRLNGYVGLDPVSLPFFLRAPSVSRLGRAYMKKHIPIARAAGQRRRYFASPEAAFSHWQGRGAFRHMSDDMLRDYIAGGLVKSDAQGEDADWELACRPQWEQAIYVSQFQNIYKAARALPDNSNIIYAGGHPSFSTPKGRVAIGKAQPAISIEFNKSLAHLFPLYQPDLAAHYLKAGLQRAALGH